MDEHDRLRQYCLRQQDALIAQCGWAVTMVVPTSTDPGAPFAYTVGLTARTQPELVIAGLDPLIAQALLNDLAARVVEQHMQLAHVRSFADLHAYLDAIDFLQDAEVPYDGSDAAVELMAAVEAEVTRRLAAPTRPYCTFGRCTYAGHDHTTHEGPDGELLAVPGPLRCLDCGHAAHYDAKLRVLRHDDPALESGRVARRCATTGIGADTAPGRAREGDAAARPGLDEHSPVEPRAVEARAGERTVPGLPLQQRHRPIPHRACARRPGRADRLPTAASQ